MCRHVLQSGNESYWEYRVRKNRTPKHCATQRCLFYNMGTHSNWQKRGNKHRGASSDLYMTTPSFAPDFIDSDLMISI